MNYEFSSDNPLISKAVNNLLIESSIYLLNFIYSHKEIEPYSNPEIRVGLSIKILLKINTYFELSVLQPIIDDINFLLNDADYLNQFANPQERKNNLTKEYILINKYIELSDTMTLNKNNTPAPAHI